MYLYQIGTYVFVLILSANYCTKMFKSLGTAPKLACFVSPAVYRADSIMIRTMLYLTAPCEAGQFLCDVEKRCIPDSIHCDGTEHCADGSDENACSGNGLVCTTFWQFIKHTNVDCFINYAKLILSIIITFLKVHISALKCIS